MKKVLLAILLLNMAYVQKLIGQSITPDVVSSSGTSFNDGISQLDWTLGEPATATFSSGSDMLTQGFHQPNLMLTSINDMETEYSVTVFPNPTIDYVQLQFQNLKYELTVEVFSADGKLLLSQTIQSANDLMLDMSKYSAGSYLLSIKDSSYKMKTYQIIKTN